MASEARGELGMDRRARWAAGRRLIARVRALYEAGHTHIMSATSAGCRCAALLRAVEGKDVGFLMDADSGVFGGAATKPRLVLGDRVMLWCPFCGESLRLSNPRYEMRMDRP